MKVIYTLFLLSLLLPFSFLSAQEATHWENYCNSQQFRNLAETNEQWIFATKGGLVEISKSDGAVTYVNKSNSGLPSSLVEAVQVSTAGDIWVGTYDAGIVRYDGKSWQVYNTSNSPLISDQVHRLQFDAIGRLWIATTEGISILDNGKWSSIDHELQTSWEISSMAMDNARNEAWYISRFDVFQVKEGQVIPQTDSISQTYTINYYMAIDTNNDVYVLNMDNLFRYNHPGWEEIELDQLPGSGNVRGMTTDADGNLTLLRENGLAKLKQGQWVYESGAVMPGKNSVEAILYDKSGVMWIANADSLFRHDSKGWNSYRASNVPLTTNSILLAEADKEGNVYVQEFNGNLYKIHGQEWTQIPLPEEFSSTNKSEMIVHPVNGKLYVATDRYGIFIWDGKQWTQQNTANSALPFNEVENMDIADDGKMYIGNFGEGFAAFDGSKWTWYKTGNSALPDNYIIDVGVMPDGKVGIATMKDGMTVYDGTSFTTYNSSPEWEQNRPHAYAQMGESLLIGGKGLLKYDGNTFESIEIPLSTTIDKFVYHLVQGSNGEIWGSIYNYGIFKYKDGNFTFYNYANSGMSSDNVRDMVMDSEGNLWVVFTSSSNGIGGVSVLRAAAPSAVSTPSINNLDYLNAYPNPVSDNLFVDVKSKASATATLEVLNALGQRVLWQENQIAAGENHLNLNVSNLTEGLYFLRTESGGQMAVRKFVIK